MPALLDGFGHRFSLLAQLGVGWVRDLSSPASFLVAYESKHLRHQSEVMILRFSRCLLCESRQDGWKRISNGLAQPAWRHKFVTASLAAMSPHRCECKLPNVELGVAAS